MNAPSSSSMLPNLPKLPGRLTAELILRSPQGLNAIKEYEINLRGNKIPAVENLSVTENQFDSIDLCDNEIIKLEGFPPLPRLSTLLVHNNRISRLGAQLGASLPKLQTLGLSNNKLSNLVDLDPLASLPSLLRLDLLGNAVTKKPNYRLYLIAKLPKLKLLDFQRVLEKERAEAVKMFPKDGPLAGKTFVPGEERADVEAASVAAAPEERKAPTQQQLTAIRAAVANASTLEEIAALEKALQGGGGDVDMAG